MTVFDASVLVDALLGVGPAGDDARDVLRRLPVLHVPSIFTAEAVSAIRSMQARGEVSPGVARGAISKIKVLHAIRYPVEPFLDRVWDLSDNLTVYDGWYIALAESLNTSLVTADRRLARASGLHCPVLTVAQFAAGSTELPLRQGHGD